jgi:hypothetical protein
MENNTFLGNTNNEFKINSDLVQIPSKGLLYSHKKSEVHISDLVTEDEDILTTESLVRSDKAFDVLLKKKIIDKDINVDELINGDKDWLLIHLRCTGYGNIFDVNVIDIFDPERKAFNTKVDLFNLKFKELTVVPDEKNEFTFILPSKKDTIKFRLLSGNEFNQVRKKSESNAALRGGVKNFITEFYTNSIMEINGNRDKLYILNFVRTMKPSDSLELQQYINEVTPGVDYNYEFVSPSTGESFFSPINFGGRLFPI